VLDTADGRPDHTVILKHARRARAIRNRAQRDRNEQEGQPTTNRYTVAEEFAHAVTHGAGLLLSVVGLIVLVVLATVRGDVWHVVSVAIYGSTLVLLYAASTFYHALPTHRAKAVFRVFDHAAIFLLIAGTYTPFTLVNLRRLRGAFVRHGRA
jgi:predicted membrane channel-forming protein YqfA (hemolysin III family)